MTKTLEQLHDEEEEVHMSVEDQRIDFSNAGLYLVGLQTVLATVACAVTSMACCLLLPAAMISAVRTLALTSLVGMLCMRTPLRIGRTRGVTTLFNALRPCVVIYIGLLTVEQLLHTCAPTGQAASYSTRRVVFHVTIAIMAAAGFWRSAKPTSETDAPFLLTALGAVVIAIMPPPATPLGGPLCQPPTMFEAGERAVRALLFGTLYTMSVYCNPPRRNSILDLGTCVVRAGAAAVWIMGAHLYVTWVALIQAGVALWARFGTELPPSSEEFGVYGSGAYSGTTYASVDTFSDGGLSDAELGGHALDRDANGVLIPEWQKDAAMGIKYHGFSSSEPILNAIEAAGEHNASATAPVSSAHVESEGVSVDPRQLAFMVGQTKPIAGATMGVSSARMAQIAASLR